jgi:hypothetical protein
MYLESKERKRFADEERKGKKSAIDYYQRTYYIEYYISNKYYSMILIYDIMKYLGDRVYALVLERSPLFSSLLLYSLLLSSSYLLHLFILTNS